MKHPNSQSNLEKEEQSWNFILPDFRLYYKATVIKHHGTETKMEM